MDVSPAQIVVDGHVPFSFAGQAAQKVPTSFVPELTQTFPGLSITMGLVSG